MKIDSNNPPPGNYEIKPLINTTGKIYISSFKSPGAKSILGKLNEKKNRWKSNKNYINIFYFFFYICNFITFYI
jgi:hypothetical protein